MAHTFALDPGFHGDTSEYDGSTGPLSERELVLVDDHREQHCKEFARQCDRPSRVW